MTPFEKKLWHLLLGHRGGPNRKRILELLSQRPYNINQLSVQLNLNYRTVKHHIDILEKFKLITTSRFRGYGEVYFLSREMEENIEILKGSTNGMNEVIASPVFLENILQHITEGIVVVNTQGKILIWNYAATAHYGFKESEMIGQDISTLFGPGIIEEINSEEENGSSGQRSIRRMQDASGTIHELFITFDKVYDTRGVFIGFTIVSLDAVKELRLKELLKEYRLRYQDLLDKLPSMIARFNRKKQLQFISIQPGNSGALILEKLVDKAPSEFIHDPGHASVIEGVIERVFNSGQMESIELEVPTPKGNMHFFGNCYPELNHEGVVETCLIVANRGTSKRE